MPYSVTMAMAIWVARSMSSEAPVDPELRLADELRWAAGRPDGTTAV